MVSYYKFGFNIGQSLEYETIYASFLTAPIANSLPIYPVGWTLTYEVFFYVIAGLVLSFINHKGLILLLLTLGLAGLTTQGPANANGGTFELMRHILLSPYQLHFAAGILLFCYQRQLARLGVIPALTFSVAAFYIAVAFLSDSAVTLGVCLGASLFIGALLNAERSGLLQTENIYFKAIIKTLVSVGNASFSLYLVHWIVFRWMGYEKTLALLSLPAWSAEVWRYLGVLAAVAISFGLHHIVERPVIKVGNSISNLITRAMNRRRVVVPMSR